MKNNMFTIMTVLLMGLTTAAGHCLAGGNVFVDFSEGQLSVLGDNEGNRLYVTLSDSCLEISSLYDDSTLINGKSEPFTCPEADITDLVMIMGGGPDRLHFNWLSDWLDNEEPFHANVTIDTGHSSDRVRFFGCEIEGNVSINTGNKTDVVELLLLEVTGDLAISTGQDTDLVYFGDEGHSTRDFQQVIVNGNFTLNTGGSWDDVAIEAPIFVLDDFSVELGQGRDFFGVGSFAPTITVGKTFYLSCGQGDDLVNVDRLVEEDILIADEVIVVGCDD